MSEYTTSSYKRDEMGIAEKLRNELNTIEKNLEYLSKSDLLNIAKIISKQYLYNYKKYSKIRQKGLMKGGGDQDLKTIETLKQQCLLKDKEINSLNQKMDQNSKDLKTEIAQLNSIIIKISADNKILVESFNKQCQERNSEIQTLKQIQKDLEYDKNMLNVEITQLKERVVEPLENPKQLPTDSEEMEEQQKELQNTLMKRAFYR